MQHALVIGADNMPLLRVAIGAALRGALRVLATRLGEQAAARLVLAAERTNEPSGDAAR